MIRAMETLKIQYRDPSNEVQINGNYISLILWARFYYIYWYNQITVDLKLFLLCVNFVHGCCSVGRLIDMFNALVNHLTGTDNK